MRTGERTFADLCHPLRDHDLCFQAVHMRKRPLFNFGQAGGKLQAGKALAQVKCGFPYRFDVVRQGQRSAEAVAFLKRVRTNACHAVRDQKFAGKVCV